VVGRREEVAARDEKTLHRAGKAMTCRKCGHLTSNHAKAE